MSPVNAAAELLPSNESRVEVAGYGIDDVTFGFDMTGSRSLPKLRDTPGLQTRRGKMLGDWASWGAFVHTLGRSVSFWKEDTLRLYVQAKLTADGSLCTPSSFSDAYQGLLERVAVVGIVSYEPAWITRVDVAVDAHCKPADGKLLLDALEAVRLPNGWRTRSVGVPRSTVYFSARASEHVKARAYCRNLKLKRGEPFGLIRLEAEERFGPRACPDEALADSTFAAKIWTSRYGKLSGTVIRLAREVQSLEIADRVKRGELDYKQGERVAMFLELERPRGCQGVLPKDRFMRREDARRGNSDTRSQIPVQFRSTSSFRNGCVRTSTLWVRSLTVARTCGRPCHPGREAGRPLGASHRDLAHDELRGEDTEARCRSFF
jgi:hypothetical protein